MSLFTDLSSAPIDTNGIALYTTGENTTLVALFASVPAGFTFSIFGGADASLFTIDPVTGVLSFNAPADFENPGSAALTNLYDLQIQISDGTTTEVQSIALSVTDVNEAPSAGAPITLGPINEDASLVITAAELLANAGDPDAGTTLVVTNLAASSGTLVDNGDGSWTFTPAVNDETAVGFTYDVSDGALATPGSATLDLLPLNDAPAVTGTGALDTPEDTARLITQADLLANVSDPDAGATLTATDLQITAGTGTLADNGDGTWTYTPVANANGTVSLSYSVSDGIAAAVNASATLTVTAVNDAPVANNDVLDVTIAEGGAVELNNTDLTANDSVGPANEAGQTLEIIDVQVDPSVGTATVRADGNHIDFEAAPDFNGTATFTYTVRDNGLTNGVADPKTATATASFTVTEVNDAPVTGADTATVAEDSTVANINVLANDRAGPANESTQTIAVIGATALNGAVTLNPDGTLNYTPNADFFGIDTITYTVQDNGTTNGVLAPQQSNGTVTVTVTEVNDAPIATGETLSAVFEDSGPHAIAFGSLTLNDSNGPNEDGPPKPPLTIASVGNAVGGTVSIVGNSVVFTPSFNFTGDASFEYTVRDAGTTNGSPDPLTSNTAVAHITVLDVPEVPPPTETMFNRGDLDFVLAQIKMAEEGQPPQNPHLAFGLREVGGTNNNAVPGNANFGAADLAFPRVTSPVYQTVTVNVDGTRFDPNPLADGDTVTSLYALPGGGGSLPAGLPPGVVDYGPRTISNLIADQTANNPAAVEAQNAALDALGDGYLAAHNPATQPNVDAAGNLFIPNVTPDAGFSAPFNTWFTLFGQFFDHGVDLVTKGGSGTVFIPLAADDPLRTLGQDGVAGTGNEVPASQAFMVLTRATTNAGADGLLGTADDVNNAGTNTITPFVDQSQTYSSHPSHQVFLREYFSTPQLGGGVQIVSTGALLGSTAADGSHHLATWADVKANALKLGLLLTDANVNDVPLLATDAYGNAVFGANGYAQVVVRTGNGADGVAGTADDVLTLVEGQAGGLALTPAALGGTLVGTGHAFINDMAHFATPVGTPDADLIAGGTPASGTYDNELLDRHYVAGDGRVNENIGLTAVHEVFHSEHNRMVEEVKTVVRAELAKGDTSFAMQWTVAGANLADGIQDNEWNGERLFQAAKFGTETQYQHLVFEEFARKVSPTIHLFGNNDIQLDPAITAEFAHAVYRFGHSMLDENVNRYLIGADGTPVLDADGKPVLNEIGLIDAFTNPLAYLNRGAAAAGEIALGTIGQVGNEIDEFVTGALRNNLLGLPLDLAALNIARGRDTGVAPFNVLRNQLFNLTHNQELKPYDSWDDFGANLKHPASLINFVAAYGTHASITGANTLAGKRDAAFELLKLSQAQVNGSPTDTGDPNDTAANRQDAYDFLHSTGAYANATRGAGADGLLNTADDTLSSPLAVHSAWSTGSVTGLDNVDLWIGGLAEKQNLFGGLLGSTFNFIFETQLENLQDADRLYYLPRLEGTHFGTEVEQNTFAAMVMAATDTRHLSANIFLTPEYNVEAGRYYAHNADGSIAHNADGTIRYVDSSLWLRNPETGKLLIDVLADGTLRFLGDDNLFGNTIVMGGTEADDRLLSGNADDDTVYGDGGNDVIDAGGGSDVVFGGTGNDVINESQNGDDILHGDSGHDIVRGGIGADILFGGDGNDVLDGGADFDEIQGGTGNDFIYGGEDDDELIGNEGDDWIEGGDGGDGLVGDIGAPTGQIPWYAANDVLIGGALGDKMSGFSGDDIMLGEGGFDKFIGGLGFDWGSFELESQGVSVDMIKREFIPNQVAPAGDAVRDFWVETEGVSGTRFDDVLGGTDDAVPDTFNELANVDLVQGLRQYFAPGPVAFSGGNIMLGSGGSDFIEGGGGNDIIDGDARLHVELTRDANGNVYSGSQIVREIRFDQVAAPQYDGDGNLIAAGDIDTAVFNDVSTNYQIELATDADGNILLGHDGAPALKVTHIVVPGVVLPVGFISDGSDTLYNIERLQFSDVTIDNPFSNIIDFAAQGALTLTLAGNPLAAGTAPQSGDVLSVQSDVFDINGVRLADGTIDPATVDGGTIPLADLTFQWQYQDLAHPNWVNIAGATGATYTATDFFVGMQLRVQASFTDGLGVKEVVYSAPTVPQIFAAAVGPNLAPTLQTQVAVPGLPDTTAQTNAHFKLWLPLTTVFTDDRTPSELLLYTATLLNHAPLESMGLHFTPPVVDAAGNLLADGFIEGDIPDGYQGTIEVLVAAADQGNLVSTDTFVINVLPNAAPTITVGNGGASALVGTPENSLVAATITASDLNTHDILSYSIVGGADAARFTIDAATGVLSFVAAPDYEAPVDAGANNVYDVVVQVSDGRLTDRQALAVTVTPVNDNAPVITSNGGGATAALSVAENTTAVTTVTATDADRPLQTITYAIAGGADAARFTIDAATGVLSFVTAPDFETRLDVGANNVYNLIVEASDNGGPDGAPVLVDTQAIAVTVTNVVGNTIVGTTGADSMNTVTGTVSAGMTVNGVVQAAGGAGATGEEDTITGLGGADVLVGLGGNDNIDGGAGADTLDGGSGNDRLAGGAGNDTFIVDSVGDTVIEGATGGTDTIRTTLNAYSLAALPNIENLSFIGTGNFTGTGNAAANVITSGAGNDTLTGGGGNDTLSGDGGDDTFNVDAGTDAVTDLAGSDVLVVTAGATANATVVANFTATAATTNNGTANLTTNGSDVNLAAAGGTNGFTVTNSGAAATLTGSTNRDTLTGGNGADVLSGGNGQDTLRGGLGADLISGGNGADTVLYTLGDGGDIVDGGNGVDTFAFSGTAGNDTLGLIYGGTPINLIDGNLLVDIESITVDLLGGTDTLDYGLLTGAAVTVNLATGVASGLTAPVAGIENVSGGSADDSITGDAGNNVLSGNLGNDLLNGGGGTDTLDGGLGDDTLLGDTGNDSLSGSFGNDLLDGGAGDDAMDGSFGNDIYVVDNVGDTITEVLNLLGGGNDTVRTTLLSYTLGANLEDLTFTGVGNFSGTGNGDANVITGGAGTDTLSGAGGADTLVGGAGNDTLNGGAGNDTFSVTAGTDTVQDLSGSDALQVSAGATANATITAAFTATAATSNAGTATLSSSGLAVNLAAASGAVGYTVTNTSATNVAATFTGSGNADTLNGAGGNDTLSGGGGADVLNGNAGADTINGDAGNDTISGGAGADRLAGGAGNDALTGGAAADNFVFNTALATAGIDTLTDFTSGADKIVLSRAVFAAFAVGGSVGAITGSLATNGGNIIYNAATGQLYYDANGGAHADAVQIALLGAGATHPTLLTTDFTVVA